RGEGEPDEGLGQMRRETAHATPGDPWTPPARDNELYLEALSERGLIVVPIAGSEYLLRAADIGLLALVEQLAHDSAAGEVAAEAALRDVFVEQLGSTVDRATSLVAELRTTATP